ncbi:hypothetical protein RJ641_005671 [Dillenia turbinata]|uniref:Uncharacterized protein n=1 Tax=Dillenia turbinata TaxID=194707 RepID=A0AAN8VGF7_9MAGN
MSSVCSQQWRFLEETHATCLAVLKMNRSFRVQESQMQKQRQGVGSLRASMTKEKDEELALFLEMRKREKERSNLLFLQNSEDFDGPLGQRPGSAPISSITSAMPARKIGTDDFLSSDNDKNDYDWLLTPPGTPLFPSLEMESQKTVMSQIGTPKSRPTALKSRLANPQPEPAAKDNSVSRQPVSSPGLNSSSGGAHRPSSSGGPGSRPATPTGRPTVSSGSKPSRPATPTRATAPSTKSTVPATKPVITATKSTATARSSTPTSRAIARSSTPTARPSSIPASKPTATSSRSATPTRRPSTPSSVSGASTPSVRPSPSVTKPASTSTASKNPVPARGASPTVRSRAAWKPSEMPGFSLDAPPNLRTSASERPLSAYRGRPGVPAARSSSMEPGPPGRPRRQSCSPSRRPAANGTAHSSGSSVPAVSRTLVKANDNVSPVLMGAKMVERVINMRKLVPPKQDDKHSPNMSGKSSSSPDSSGFGRTLSKKSLDMAIRHMDIRRSIPGNLRPLMTNIPASSMYSVRTGPTRSRQVSVSDSPLATSSNASSEVSVNNNGLCIDSNGQEDEVGSERGRRASSASLRGR